MSDLLAIALLANEDPSMAAVLGDAIQEAAWFDPRVMQLVYPLGSYPAHGYRSANERAGRQRDRAIWKDGFPLYFQGFAAKPTATFVRAVLAVLLFGEWRKRPWPMFYALAKKTEQAMRAREDERRREWMATVHRGTQLRAHFNRAEQRQSDGRPEKA